MKRALALAASAPGIALACSGPGAASAVEFSRLFALGCAITSVLLTALFVVRLPRFKSTPFRAVTLIAVLLCVAHPGFWEGSRGDCGSTRMVLSMAGLSMHISLVVIAYRLILKPVAP